MKKIVFSILSVCLLAGCSNGDNIITVGKESITKDELFDKLVTSSTRSIIEREIHDLLIFQEITVKDDETLNEIEELKKIAQVSSIEELKKIHDLDENGVYTLAKRRIAEKKILIKEASLSTDLLMDTKEQVNPDIYANYMSFEDKKSAQLVQSLIGDGSSLENVVHSLDEDYYLTFKWLEKVDETFYTDLIDVEISKTSPILKKEDKYWIFEIAKNPTNVYISSYERVLGEASEKSVTLFTIYEKLEKKYKLKIKEEKLESMYNEKNKNN